MKELFTDSAKKIVKIIKSEWAKSMPYRVAFIEFRTTEKGVMREKLDDFNVKQLECLISKFSSISHLSETNQECFNGKLFDPINKTEFTRATQAND